MELEIKTKYMLGLPSAKQIGLEDGKINQRVLIANLLTQNVSSLALRVWDRQCLEDSEQKDDIIIQSINEIIKCKGVYRTDLATPGLSISYSCSALCI